MTRQRNLFAKQVKPNQCYEIWMSDDNFIYLILKKWQLDDEKPYARWLTLVFSPMTSERGEIGDAYTATVKHGNKRIVTNPNAYTIRYHVHAEKPAEGEKIDSVDTWLTTIKQAFDAYDEYCSEYVSVSLEAALYQDVDADPVETQSISVFGVPVQPSGQQRFDIKQYQVASESYWEQFLLFGGDGYDTMELAEKKGWYAIGEWGKHGWNLGSWPLVVIYFRKKEGQFQVIEWVEGDATMYACSTKEERNAVVDHIAFWHWKHQGEAWVAAYDSVEQFPEDLRGPYRA